MTSPARTPPPIPPLATSGGRGCWSCSRHRAELRDLAVTGPGGLIKTIKDSVVTIIRSG